jgi:hypothetical protein
MKIVEKKLKKGKKELLITPNGGNVRETKSNTIRETVKTPGKKEIMFY